MKSISFFLIITAFFWINIPTYAQDQIISLTEITEIILSKKNWEIPSDQTGIVDLNSTIKIELHLDQIEAEMSKFQGLSSTDARLIQLQVLNRILEMEVAITNYINAGFKNRANAEEQLNYFIGLNRLGMELLSVVANDTTLYYELTDPETDRQSNLFDGTYPEFMIYFLNQKADGIRKKILSSLDLFEGGSAFQVYFRLAAFLRNKDGGRSIHIENFDDFGQKNAQGAARFTNPIPQVIQNAIKENATLNNQLEGGIGQAVENFKGAMLGYEQELYSYKRQFDNFDSVYRSNMEILQELPNTLPAAEVLKDNSIVLNHVESLYNTLFSRYNDFARLFSPDEAQNEKLDETLIILENTIRNAYAKFDYAMQKHLLDRQASGKTELELVKQEYKNYVETARKNIIDVNAFVQKIRNSIRPIWKAYLENEEFSNKVSGIGGGAIPGRGFISLNYIGTIQPGDEILIKATLERGANDTPDFEEREIFSKVIQPQRIKPYIRMVGSIIFANPYTRTEIPIINLENNFQFAPTYSFIVGMGSRKNNFYNKFINVGFGVSFSSMDFNLDGTPEFGAGMMATAFRDILSAGWGWNFGVDAPYTFIGFNIPFGGFPSAN